MAQQNREFFAAYIGGLLSMQIRTVWTNGSDEDVPAMLRSGELSRYLCSEAIRLPCPERLVAIYAWADACMAVRLEIFRVVAALSGLSPR